MLQKVNQVMRKLNQMMKKDKTDSEKYNLGFWTSCDNPASRQKVNLVQVKWWTVYLERLKYTNTRKYFVFTALSILSDLALGTEVCHYNGIRWPATINTNWVKTLLFFITNFNIFLKVLWLLVLTIDLYICWATVSTSNCFLIKRTATHWRNSITSRTILY